MSERNADLIEEKSERKTDQIEDTNPYSTLLPFEQFVDPPPALCLLDVFVSFPLLLLRDVIFRTSSACRREAFLDLHRILRCLSCVMSDISTCVSPDIDHLLCRLIQQGIDHTLILVSNQRQVIAWLGGSERVFGYATDEVV